VNPSSLAVLGVGNILERDDGIAVYAAVFLQENFIFDPPVTIVNGGVEGINLLNFFTEHDRILILDALDLDDTPGSIYHIPSHELTGCGINSGGAHEVGVLQCIDMLELMGKPLPDSSVLGIVPERVEVGIGLTATLAARFDDYVATAVSALQREGIAVNKKPETLLLENIIERFRNPLR